MNKYFILKHINNLLHCAQLFVFLNASGNKIPRIAIHVKKLYWRKEMVCNRGLPCYALGRRHLYLMVICLIKNHAWNRLFYIPLVSLVQFLSPQNWRILRRNFYSFFFKDNTPWYYTPQKSDIFPLSSSVFNVTWYVCRWNHFLISKWDSRSYK